MYDGAHDPRTNVFYRFQCCSWEVYPNTFLFKLRTTKEIRHNKGVFAAGLTSFSKAFSKR